MERAIAYLLFTVTTANDHVRSPLVATGAVALGRGTPRAHRMTASGGLTFTTTVRVIHRVHNHATNRRADTAPAVGTGLADGAQVVLGVADFTNGGAAIDVHLTDF